MDLKDKSVGGVIVAAAPGRIDLSNAEQFQDALLASLGNARTALVLDLSAADLITSGGFRALVIVQKASKTQNKGFAITSLRPLVKEVPVRFLPLIEPYWNPAKPVFEIDTRI